MSDIKQLAQVGYPEASVAILETLSRDQFINALVDNELQLWVVQARMLENDIRKKGEQKPRSLSKLKITNEMCMFCLGGKQERATCQITPKC